MFSLQVRELPEQIYKKLQSEAKKEHRSLTQQAIVTLARGLNIIENPQKRRLELLQTILDNPIITNDTDYSDPIKLVREDRER